MERLCHLENRSPKVTHGELLSGIYDLLTELSGNVDIFVRERAFSRFPHETQALSKVVGIADLVAWQQAKAQYEE